MAKRETRERIVATALRLFNAEGTRKVTTNHIAKAMKISPGNLYYYFETREHIIREIVEKMIAEYDRLWNVPPGVRPTAAALQAVLSQTFRLLWEYRFFQRDVNALLLADPRLRRRYRRVRARRMGEIAGFLAALGEAGLLRLPADSVLTASLVKVAWLITDYWLPYLEVEGLALDEARVREGVGLILALMRPYLAPGVAADLTTKSLRGTI